MRAKGTTFVGNTAKPVAQSIFKIIQKREFTNPGKWAIYIDTNVFFKDSIKEVLGDTIGFSNREENKKLSNATAELMCFIFSEFGKLNKNLILYRYNKISNQRVRVLIFTQYKKEELL